MGQTIVRSGAARAAIVWFGLAAAVFAPVSAANAAAPLANGEYDCAIPNGMGVMPLGRMDINGSSYRFRPMGNVSGGFAPYSVASNGSLHWSAGMGGITTPPSVLISSDKRTYGFSVYYRASPGGFAETMTCSLMKK